MTVLFAQATVFCVMVVLALWEAWRETGAHRRSRAARWPANIGLAVINAGLAIFAPLSAVSAALLAGQWGWGILNMVSAPFATELVLGLAVLTFANYAIHRALHTVPLLWRLHRIHHCDTDIDSTTAFRHHPVEVLFTAAATSLFVLAFGVDPAIALTLSFVDQLWAIWTHSGLRLPLWLHRRVCFVFVTPLTHRIHHSTDARETDTNYGNTVTIWDRLLNTHLVEPVRDETEFETGLEYSRQDSADLDFLLKLPFHKV